MMSTKTTFQIVAEELANAFETAERPNGQKFVRVKKDAPDWVTGGADGLPMMLDVHKALDDRMPDDWVYEAASRVMSDLADIFDSPDDAADRVHEIADSLTEVYNGELIRWLADHPNNAILADEAAEELGEDTADITRRAQLGQFMAYERIATALIEAIETEAEQRDDADDDE